MIYPHVLFHKFLFNITDFNMNIVLRENFDLDIINYLNGESRLIRLISIASHALKV